MKATAVRSSMGLLSIEGTMCQGQYGLVERSRVQGLSPVGDYGEVL